MTAPKKFGPKRRVGDETINVQAPRVAKGAPVCSTCGDTHRMMLGEEGSEREVPCTHCPVPCSDCRAGGLGAYCAETPCSCRCHQKSFGPGKCLDCGGTLRFDPTLQGETCGGLALVGWDVCTKCGKAWLSKRGRPADEQWKLSKGDRAIDLGGGGRLRLDGGNKATEKVMRRIARLPELEAVLRKIAAGAHDPQGLALSVLSEPHPSADVDGTSEIARDETGAAGVDSGEGGSQ